MTNPNIQNILRGAHLFAHAGILHTLNNILLDIESYAVDHIAGGRGVRFEHVDYCQKLAQWCEDEKDRLSEIAADIPILHQYVRRTQELVNEGMEAAQAAAEHPGFAYFETAIAKIQRPEVPLVVDNLNPPKRSEDPEDDSNEVVWLNDYYGELLELREVFRNAKLVYVHFAGWALFTMPQALFTVPQAFFNVSAA